MLRVKVRRHLTGRQKISGSLTWLDFPFLFVVLSVFAQISSVNGNESELKESSSPCNINVCLNGGSCSITKTKEGNENFHCECSEEWKGHWCQHKKMEDPMPWMIGSFSITVGIQILIVVYCFGCCKRSRKNPPVKGRTSRRVVIRDPAEDRPSILRAEDEYPTIDLTRSIPMGKKTGFHSSEPAISTTLPPAPNIPLPRLPTDSLRSLDRLCRGTANRMIHRFNQSFDAPM